MSEEAIQYMDLNHMAMMSSIRAESAIMVQRLSALEADAPDYTVQHLALLDEYIITGVNPMSAILTYINGQYAEGDAQYQEMIETALMIGEVFKLLNEKNEQNRLISGQ